MFIASILFPVIGGLIAMAPLIVSKRPDAKDLLDKITPYAGWVGMTLFVWGVWEIIDSVLTIGSLGSHPILWALNLATGAGDFGLGLLLGFGLISKYMLSKNATAMEKGQQLRAKLAPYQAILGGVEIALGLAYTLVFIIF